jgi:hypothetical protein
MNEDGVYCAPLRGYASESEGKPQKGGENPDNIQMWEKTGKT